MGRELRPGHRAPAQPGRPPHQRLQPHQEPGPRRRVSLPGNSAAHLTEDRIQVAGASRRRGRVIIAKATMQAY